jgi:hypothetical protein
MMINVNYINYIIVCQDSFQKWNMCFLKENQHPIVALCAFQGVR